MIYREELITYWKQELKTITLTNEQLGILANCIANTKLQRAKKHNVRERLTKRKDFDGSIRFSNAARNAKHYRELEIKLEQILEIIKKA